MFYDNLQKICEIKGLKITPLILECGGTKGAIGGWKKGVYPNSEMVLKLAVRLGVSCDYLLTGKEPTPKLSENERDMLYLLNQVSERNQVRLIGNVENMVKEMNKPNIQAEENAG